jgi:hypothetical protein
MKPIFSAEFDKLAQLMLPTFLRPGAVIGAMLRAAVLPLAMNHVRLVRLLADTADEMSYNGQAFNLQRMLNDYFDPMMRRIAVNGVPDGSGCFTVRAPAGFNDAHGTADRMRANIDKYKLVTTKYVIEWT